ncbi:MAG: aspartate aminotransferase family protein, partial [Myxococcota bacterium]|nr:aspartate aminotransferase family protein [Myxococcota bacterium]
IGSMFHLWLGDPQQPAQNYAETKASNLELFQKLYQGLLQEGIYMAPSAFEVGFMSSTHTKVEVEKTCDAFKKVIAAL